MTHTAGFCYDMWTGDLARYMEKTGTPGIITCLNTALKTPGMTDPGTRWEYGINIDFVGKAVEAASGKKLDACLIDPSRDVTGVILMQLLPFADAKCLQTFAGFERGVYAGLDAGSGQKAA